MRVAGFFAVERLAFVERVAVLRAVVLRLAAPLLAFVDREVEVDRLVVVFFAVDLEAVDRFAVPDLAFVDFDAVVDRLVVFRFAAGLAEDFRLAVADLALVDLVAVFRLVVFFAVPLLAFVERVAVLRVAGLRFDVRLEVVFDLEVVVRVAIIPWLPDC